MASQEATCYISQESGRYGIWEKGASIPGDNEQTHRWDNYITNLGTTSPSWRLWEVGLGKWKWQAIWYYWSCRKWHKENFANLSEHLERINDRYTTKHIKDAAIKSTEF